LLELKILVYEYFSGGGLDDNPLSLSTLCEGLEMLRNLISDFKLAGHSVTTILDSKILNLGFSSIRADKIINISCLEELQNIIGNLSKSIDAAYVIAPETNETLQTILKIIKRSGIISLNCYISSIDEVYDKIRMDKFLKNRKMKTPKSKNFTIFDKLFDIKNNIRKNF